MAAGEKPRSGKTAKVALSNNTRQNIIERTVVLLARKGLQATSFSQILEESGAPRVSLYHYFPGGKDELVLEAVAFAGENAMAVLERMVGRTAVEIAEAFVGPVDIATPAQMDQRSVEPFLNPILLIAALSEGDLINRSRAVEPVRGRVTRVESRPFADELEDAGMRLEAEAA